MRFRTNFYKLGALALILGICNSCNLPKDPKGSWTKIKARGNLQIGIVENLPFTFIKDSQAQGSEARLIENFGNQYNLNFSYQSGSESELIKKLENYELDILLGGFDKNTIWKKKAGLSLPYDEKHVILVPKGENRLLYQLEKYLENPVR
jgi:membrane-bound lytic murein transglycosylase MltF